MEILTSGMIVFYASLMVLWHQKETNCGGFKTWLIGSSGFYILDLIVSMNQLMFIKKKSRESIWLYVAMFIVLLGNTGWYIYGNVLYWNNYDVCMDPTISGSNYDLAQAMFTMIIIGYFTMCKCCCITSFLLIAVPCLIRMYRQGNRPNWEQTAPSLLRNLASGKFEPPADNENGE